MCKLQRTRFLIKKITDIKTLHYLPNKTTNNSRGNKGESNLGFLCERNPKNNYWDNVLFECL